MDKKITLTIDDLGTEGQGIGRNEEGMAVFVEGALPGERVVAEITQKKKNYALARLVEIEEQSPLRIKPPCRYFGRCGGCNLQHLSYAGQLEYKQKRVEDSIKRIGGLDVPVLFPLPSQKQLRYRNKVAFPLEQRADGGVSIGLHREGTHDVVDITDCQLVPEPIAVAVSQLRVWIARLGVTIYDRRTGKGLLRHVVFRINHKGEMMLILAINGKSIPKLSMLQMLFKLALPQVKSIVYSHNRTRSSVILGEEHTAADGLGYMFEQLDGLEYKIAPESFFQINTEGAELLHKNLLKELDVQPGDIAIDLYSGTGALSLLLAGHAKEVYGVEISAGAVKDARFNAQLNERENAHFTAGDAEFVLGDVMKQAGHADIVVVDPPRKGLEKALIEKITELAPRAVGYVSCDPATLARDLAVFAELDYRADSIQPIDLFPQTTHVETVVLMSRVEN